jgi:hypothetical protein
VSAPDDQAPELPATTSHALIGLTLGATESGESRTYVGFVRPGHTIVPFPEAAIEVYVYREDGQAKSAPVSSRLVVPCPFSGGPLRVVQLVGRPEYWPLGDHEGAALPVRTPEYAECLRRRAKPLIS